LGAAAVISMLKRHAFQHAFLVYSYVSNLWFGLLNLMPHPIRWLAFRFMLARLGRGTLIDYGVYFRYPRDIEIGDHVSINRGCEFFTSSNLPSRIRIGNHVAIAPYVRLYAAGHDYRRLSLPDTAGDITIGDHCWIGANSVILQGVQIGEGAIIAAGSVVTRDIPSYAVAAGVPARVLKQRVVQPPDSGERDAA